MHRHRQYSLLYNLPLCDSSILSLLLCRHPAVCTSNSDIMQVKVESWSKAAVERASRNAINENFRVMGVMGYDIKGSSCPGSTLKDLLAVAQVCSTLPGQRMP